MGLTGNFEQVTLDGEVMNVSGSSSGPDGDGELVSRAVAIHQGTNVVHGLATSGLKWTADSLAAPGFEAGKEAVTLGCETYFKQNIGALPAFVTFTWSQIVTIAGK